MFSISKCSCIAALALSTLLAPSISSAQMPPGGGGRSHDGIGKGRGMPTPRAEQAIVPMVPLADEVGEQLGLAREALKMSATQLPLWQEFEIRAAQLVTDLKRWKQRTRLASENIAAPLAAERQIDIARNHLTALEDLSSAMRALYAALGDSQRVTADKTLPQIVGLLVNGGDVPAASKHPPDERNRPM
jgi:hypothetical protein